MLGEWPTLELVLGTKRGPEGPSILQGSPNGVKLIEDGPALSYKSNKSVLPRSSIEGQERTRRQTPILLSYAVWMATDCSIPFSSAPILWLAAFSSQVPGRKKSGRARGAELLSEKKASRECCEERLMSLQ